MSNKYHGTNPAVDDSRCLHGRSDVFQQLDNHVKNRRSVVVMGVEGVGKSSLLNCYFNPAYRRKMAIEERLLIRVTDFPTDRDTDGIYQYLAEGVLRAVDSLDQEETNNIYEKIRGKCAVRMKECQDPASRFQQVCEIIQEYDYRIVLVIDGFERFVSSPYVKMEHHNLMNTLISKNLSFVVATNYDFNQDSLPASVSGSFLLMKFSGNEIRLGGLAEEASKKLVFEGDFSEEEMHQLWILSGGVPAIFRRAAEHTYDQKQAGDIVWKTVFKDTYKDVFPLLDRWCRWLSADQIRVLKALADSDSMVGVSFEEDSLRSSAQVLLNRGLLVNPVEANTLRLIQGMFKFNTPLLKLYCKENELRAEKVSGEETIEYDDEKLVEMYGKWAEKNGYPRPISFKDPLPAELLRQYQLTEEVLNSYDEDVQRFIITGILVDQTFLSVEMTDRSPAFLEFAKALELHINKTVVPMIKLIDPDYVVANKKKMRNTSRLMLGQFITMLNASYRIGRFSDKAAKFCEDKHLNSFDKNWWEKVKRNMSEIEGLSHKKESTADIRNDIAHVGFITEERGAALLRMMFLGEKSLFNRCQRLHDEAEKKGVIPH